MFPIILKKMATNDEKFLLVVPTFPKIQAIFFLHFLQYLQKK
jgi:hypothetical protein